MRESRIKRKTNETDIELYLNIDGTGKSNIDTGIGFMDHMLTLFSKHAQVDLSVKCIGDTYVDYHHSVEDIGIALGSALKEALGEKYGINRYGFFILPMDESLVETKVDILSAVDISGRSYLSFDLGKLNPKVGDFDTELIEEFFQAFTRASATTLHIKKINGRNTHHIIEACFKSFARSLKTAISLDEKNLNSLPSTKGIL
ncbi:imidazoleglycerol-phosphate dehydratase HisB [bacterium]|nr:imidazoleglycerol-phosphate dehydratase HisB [bacterium]